MAKVAFLAHCLLNQNAKVLGGAKRPAMWEPVVDLLVRHGWQIQQMPCPELAFGGVRRFWWVREQADTPVFRAHCRRLAQTVATVMEPHVSAGDDVVMIGVDSSPTMGVDFQPSSSTWGGEPNIGPDDTHLIEGEGIFLEELRAELETRGLPMPRRTGIRHWFADYDEAEERQRILALLGCPDDGEAPALDSRAPVDGDPRSERVAVVAGSLFAARLAELGAAGFGIIQLPDREPTGGAARESISETVEQIAEYLRAGYDVTLVDDGVWGSILDDALAGFGSPPLRRS